MTAWWLAWRYMGSLRTFFNLSTILSVVGMAIGVASLVVSMAVFSGYISTLEKTVQDAVGHVIVLRRGAVDPQEMLNEIRSHVSTLVAETPFAYAEAILADKGKISGVLIEGVDDLNIHKVLNLNPRILSGELNFQQAPGKPPKVLIGKEIAKKFKLSVGDMVRLVVPLTSEFQTGQFQPKLGRFIVAGVINFGRHDFDSRYVLMELKQLQKFVEIGSRITGYRIKIKDPQQASAVATDISMKLGSSYWARDWRDVNRNLFEAARLEKAILFFVLMILVVAAAFNIANTLFISVVQRYRDISVLKTLGATNSLISRIFTAQGLIVGVVGAVSGIVLGLGLCLVLEWAQGVYKLVPAEVYKLDRIDLNVQGLDLLAIVVGSLVICFVATLVPSKRGARISPVEGLRYE